MRTCPCKEGVTQILNVVLDILLIVVLRQGVRAAALASCLSMSVGSLITLFLFVGKRLDLYYTTARISWQKFLRILANGSSEFFSNIASSILSLVMNLVLLRYGGTTAVAAFSVVMYVDGIVGMLIFGLCEAMQPAISYCYGARLITSVKGGASPCI